MSFITKIQSYYLTCGAQSGMSACRGFYKVWKGSIDRLMWRTTAKAPKATSSGQYGKNVHYSIGSYEVRVFSEPEHSIYKLKVKHPKVVCVQEPELSGDGLENKEMRDAISKTLKIGAQKNWDALNTKLKALGYGGILINYQRWCEFIGYGDHTEGEFNVVP